MGARPYDPTLGRFLTTDPIDSGSLNNYDYTGQDPVNGYDLSGLFLANAGGDCEIGSCGGNTPTFNPDGIASASTIVQRLTGHTPTQILRAAGSYAGTCLTGMALGTPEGPGGFVGGCIVTVAIRVAKESPNSYERKVGTWANLLNEARSIQTMHAILKDPTRAENLIEEWRSVLRR